MAAKQLSVRTFEPHVGTSFRMDVGDDGLDLVLSEASQPQSPGPGGDGGRAQFSLYFTGPPQPILPQRIYRLAHPSLGDLELFLVPVGADADCVTYEAAFA
jgi:hypothetical protein